MAHDEGPGRQETAADRDTQLLHEMGYAQELWRRMGGFANFAVSFSIISILTGAITSYDLGLAAGGPGEMGIGWPIVCVFSLLVAMAMAEIASAFPTAGGLYHWSAILGGVGWGWATAWLNLLGLVTMLAAINFGAADFLIHWVGPALASLGPLTPDISMTEPARLKQWEVFLTGLVVASQALINHRGIALTAFLTDISAWVNMAGALLLTVSLLALARHHPVSWLFQTVNETGAFKTSSTDLVAFPRVESPAWALMLGFLMAAYTMTGYDASAHTAEETMDAPQRVPWGIVMSVVVSGVAGYVMIAAITLAIQDLPAAVASGNVVVTVMKQGLPHWLDLLIKLLISLAQYFCGLATVTSISRMVYAFARDGGMPASARLRRIDPRHRTPAAAIWLGAGLSMVFTIYFSRCEDQIYATITSVATIALYLSYAIPVFLGLFARGRTWTRPGPWTLGPLGRPVALVASLWVAFLCVVMVQPPNQLAGTTLLGIAILLGLYWALIARRRFEGPPRGVLSAQRQAALAAVEAKLAAAAD